MIQHKVILYGHFGSGSIGNDSSLEAALYHVRKYQPNANIVCVCRDPREIARRFGIEALAMSGLNADKQSSGSIISHVKRLSMRLMDEINFWLKLPSWFQPGDQFIVVGTGAVDDGAVRRPWHAPYELYKWCKTAKMGGARVIFLSVGVGPIMNRISRFLMLNALRMADYRSYREVAAFNYLHTIGYDTSGDLMYPDLVFSLPKEALPIAQAASSTPKVVGLGLINYYGWRHDPGIGEAVYQEYFSKIKRFASWLFRKGFKIRLLVGDTTDQRPVQEFIEHINKEGESAWRERLIIEEILTVNELFDQIAQTDLVVASRFHNVLCALMLERLVISLGYHEKNENLMKDMGLEGYCHHIEKFSVEWLIERFHAYEAETDQAIRLVHERMGEYHKLLEQQYRNVLSSADS